VVVVVVVVAVAVGVAVVVLVDHFATSLGREQAGSWEPVWKTAWHFFL